MKRIVALFLIFVLFLSSCSSPDADDSATAEFFAMDTYMSVTAYGSGAEQAVEKAQKRVEELDKILSAENKNSEIYKLNKNGKAHLSDDAFKVVSLAVEYCGYSGGTFNPAMHRLSVLWGFVSKKYYVPKKAEIRPLLKNIDVKDIILNSNKNYVEFKKSGMEIDLGGIAKGFAAAEVKRILTESGVDSAVINLGGNVCTLGTKPDGSDWNVAIQHPDGDGYAAVVKVSGKAVVTSGGYERYFEKNGKTYHHILNPEDGYPADKGLKSVTIISDNDVLADALSTALFVMGEKDAEEFRKKSDEKFEFILYTDDGRLVVSEGIADSVESDIDFEIVK